MTSILDGAVLERLPLFAGVEKERLRKLESSAGRLDCRGGEVVYRTGDPCDGLYVVLSGAVLFRAERVGQPVERIQQLGAGEAFGEKEVLSGEDRELTLRALGETALLRIPLTPLRSLLAEHPLLETSLRTLTVRRRSAGLRVALGPQSRKEPRIWVDRPVCLALASGEKVRVRLEDLSPGGACLTGVPALWRPGLKLTFDLGLEGRPGLLNVVADVRWRQGSTVGVAFQGGGSVHRKAVEHALKALTGPRS